METAIAEMEAEMTDFGKEFLFQEAKARKAKTGTSWLAELEKFVQIKEKLGVVASKTKQLLKRHGVHQ